MKTKHLTLYSDGGARGNPGPAGAGAVLREGGKTVAALKRSLGEATNNQAEYQALLMGLEEAKRLGATQVACFLDSELVVKQLNRQYKMKNQELGVWFVKVHNLCQEFDRVTFTHVPREENTAADRLVNEALDEAAGS
ncbi:MAG: ribonuclease HI family protein [Candidatus Kerfeldbacteria bacterium]|nr:ribonuclease HI family protein [Candidatus Kerfeldbacteria bacterium]